MLRWISILGGLLIMMGQHDRSEALFYYFRLEDQVPENHLLRLIDKHTSLEFVRQQLKESYSETGRPSIDPELLLRILLIGYLYGISSERLHPCLTFFQCLKRNRTDDTDAMKAAIRDSSTGSPASGSQVTTERVDDEAGSMNKRRSNREQTT